MKLNPAAWYSSLVLMPRVIDAPGAYLTRSGEVVEVKTVGSLYRHDSLGRYSNGVAESWHVSGRVFFGLTESQNDIVSKAQTAVG